MSAHGHSHRPHHAGGHAHDHTHLPSSRRVLILAVGLTLGFALVEFIAGRLSGSLALVADAGHMLTDSTALTLAAVAAWFAERPASKKRTWGYGRVEVLAALVNALVMLALITFIAWQALSRFQNPREISGGMVTAVALIGLGVNLLVFYVLSRGERNLNVRGALLHVLGDLLGSVAAITSGLVIILTGWTPIDPILSLLICGLILIAALHLLADGIQIMLNGVPQGLTVDEVRSTMLDVADVEDVHDLHVWQVSSEQVALSAHVVIGSFDRWPDLLGRINATLLAAHGINHATLQPELVAEQDCEHVPEVCR